MRLGREFAKGLMLAIPEIHKAAERAGVAADYLHVSLPARHGPLTMLSDWWKAPPESSDLDG